MENMEIHQILWNINNKKTLILRDIEHFNGAENRT